MAGEAQIELGYYLNAVKTFERASKEVSFLNIDDPIRLKILDKLTRLHFWYGEDIGKSKF